MIEIDYCFLKSKLCKEPSDYYVYHYTSPEGLEGIIRTNSLHFTNIYFLNDNTEIIHTYKILNDLLPSLKNEINEKLYIEIENRVNEIINPNYLKNKTKIIGDNDFYIASFSTEKDNLALWNNYTKTESKVGYNIGFNLEKLKNSLKTRNLANSNSPFLIPSMVNYNLNEQKAELEKCIKKYNSLINNNNYFEVCRNLLYNLIVYSLFFKHKSFSIENEYRIVICNIGELEDNKLEFKIRNGLFIPYISCELSGKTQVNEREIEKITCSPTINKEIAKYSLVKLFNKYGYSAMSDFINFSQIIIRSIVL